VTKTKVHIPAGSSIVVKIDGPATVTIKRTDAVELPAEAASTATTAGISEAIALVTGRRNGIPLGLSGDVPPGSVAAGLTTLAAAFLTHLLPDARATALLSDIAIAVARDESAPPNKETR
jgi:hypothetical protein